MNFLACAMAVLAASAGAADGAELIDAQIDAGSGFVASGTGTACNVTNPPVISVTSSGYAAVWVNFKYNGATWRLPMTNGVTPYCLQMPVIPAGTVEYRIEGGDTFDPYSSTNAVESLPTAPGVYHTYVNTATLTEQRKPNLATWYSTVFQPGGYTDDTHVLFEGINPYWYSAYLSMNYDGTVNFRGSATSGTAHSDAALRTRVKQPVGSIWFKARYTGDEGTGTLIVERSTNISLSSIHDPLATLQVPATTQ